MATRGNMEGAKMTVLLPVEATVSTAARPTSLPVPAVVGIAITGGSCLGMKRSPPRASSNSSKDLSGTLARTMMSLATSIAAPPPRATMPSAPAARYARAPCSTSASVGLLDRSAKMRLSMACAWREASTAFASPASTTPRSVTSRTRPLTKFFASAPLCAALPAPKTMRVGYDQTVKAMFGEYSPSGGTNAIVRQLARARP
jgi:hypothetical protein